MRRRWGRQLGVVVHRRRVDVRFGGPSFGVDHDIDDNRAPVFAEPSDVRSVDSRSGSIGKMTAGVYTDVVFWRAVVDRAARRHERFDVGIATRMRVAPFVRGSDTDNWSRSRLSSLSIEHQAGGGGPAHRRQPAW